MAAKSSFKNMTLCLTAICLVCSGLLAGVYALTKDSIEAAKIAKNEAAIKNVLPDVAVTIGEESEVGYKGEKYKYNLAYTENGSLAGVAINVAPVGFGGPIEIKIGFDADGVIWNTKVLSQAETPGLGAKCVEEKFSAQFKGLNPDTLKLAVKKDGGHVDAITASTITSRAYTAGVALAVQARPAAIAKAVLPDVAVTIEEEREVGYQGKLYKYNLAYTEEGDVAGVAITVAADGFNGPIEMKVGFDADGAIWDTMVLSHDETPGLGVKCADEQFARQFKGFAPTTKNLALKVDGGDVDAISGSTITSRAYVECVALAVQVREAIANTPMLIDEATAITDETK